MKLHTLAIGLLLSSTLTSPAWASPEIERLEQKVERLERVIEKLTQEQENAPKLALRPGPRINTKDGAYRFALDGFVQADAAWVNDDTTDLPGGTTIKRARLGVKGTLAHDWHYRILTDFGESNFKLIDANLSYTGIDNTKITTGQFREFFSIEQLTPSKYWTFNEKASVAALTPKRAMGAGVTYHYGKGHVSAGVFGENLNKKRKDDEGTAVTARAVYDPVQSQGRLVHLGLSGTYREPDAQTRSVTFKNGGENTVTGAIVNTGAIQNVASITSVNPEIVLTYDNLSLQGEYIHTQVERNNADTLTFSGYYGELSYFLTGESRNYNARKGSFGKITPNQDFNLTGEGLGAWQAAYRYSAVDLNDSDITGGSMHNHTLGLNWFPNTYTRMAANAIYVSADEHRKAPEENPMIVMLRAQFEF